ncbi:hypothetical protein F4801DRAFT_51390 [Xylaria longipes]|nr:hypothetical protein F4801DRAFT_51390 [Xylaria longipes]RYC63991.1 hypothetical protein CHU98_g2228 [Xylaria longipes]
MLLPVLAAALLVNGVSSTTVPQRRDIPTEACTAHLIIDDFSSWLEGKNSLAGDTSDDATFNSTNTDGGALTFIPSQQDTAYLYEQFECIDTVALGYDSVSFYIKGPEAASVSLELQTKANCSAAEYQSSYYTINGLSGSLETITVPLSSWTNASLAGTVGFVWYGFSAGVSGTDNEWQLDNFQLVCAAVAPPGDPPATTPSPTPTPTLAPTSSVTTITVTVTPTSSTTRRVPTPTPWPDDPWGDDPWDDDDPWGWGKRDELEGVTLRAAADHAEVESRAAAACELSLIDDWASQSRLTFLYYNAMLKPTSDDGTMKSVVVTSNTVTLTPTDTDSYFYSQLGCFDARNYGGVSLRITAAAGTTFDVTLSSSKDNVCSGDSTKDVVVTTKSLGWTFNGKEQLYSIPFSKFSGLDYSKFTQVIFSGLNKAVKLGPIAIYCNTTVAEYVAPPIKQPQEPTATVPAPSSTATALVIDTFGNGETNALGQWHGTEDEGLQITFKRNTMTLQTSDADLTWQTQISATCLDMRSYDGAYLHIAYTGSNKFTVALQQHNDKCDNDAMPYPATWDSLEAARYSTATDIYIPMNHFNIDRSKVIGVALKGFYSTTATVFSKIEVVNKVPAGFKVPVKLASGTFVFACKRPNSFAFAIDDGDPAYAQEVMRVIDEAGFKATFFTVGAPLLDPSTNLSNVYREMESKGHQIALHSYTHPGLEGLADEASIDWEYTNDLKAVSQVFGQAQNTKYFRPPFGTEGARMRQRYAALVPDPYIVQWSVDIEDWLWAETSTPEKQIDAFQRDVTAGGSITVMHYLYNSTVSYLPQFIKIAKASGKQLMRVDQCMMDPDAPPL